MRPTLTLLGKEFALFLKDKAAIFLTFLVPFFVIYIVGNIFSDMGNGDSGGLNATIKIAAYNASGDPAGDRLLEGLDAEEGLDLIRSDPSQSDAKVPFTRESIRQGIVDNHYNFALIVPENYLKEGEIGLRLEFISNPKNAIEAQIVNGLIQKAVFTKMPQLLAGQLDQLQREQLGEETYDQFLDGVAALVDLSFDDLAYDEIRSRMSLQGLVDSLSEPAAGDAEGTEGEDTASAFLEGLVTLEEDQVYGKDLENPYLTRMIGGYAIMFLLFATTGSASSLFEERNEGLFLRLLSMPVTRLHILWSKYIFNTLLGIAQALVLFIASSFLFDVDVFSNFASLFVVSVFAAAAATSFGMALASISRTPQQANGFGTLLIISMSAMGGAWFPLAWMPEPMQVIGKFTVVYWGVEGYLGALWEKASILQLAPTLGVLLAIAVGLNLLSSWRFRTGDLFR